MHRLTRGAVVALALLASGCGTAVYRHQVRVQLETAAGKAVERPLEVSIFDHTMGYSRDWARQSMGTTSADSPYVGSFSSTRSVSIVEHELPPQLDIAFAVPALASDGYYLLSAALPAPEPRDGEARYVAYDAYFPAADAPGIPVTYRSTPMAKGWSLELTVRLPAPK